jgi:hypothetical protein
MMLSRPCDFSVIISAGGVVVSGAVKRISGRTSILVSPAHVV